MDNTNAVSGIFTFPPAPMLRRLGLSLLMICGQALAGAAANDDPYTSEDSCAACHPAQFQAWSGSQHDLAMQAATPATVLGDFNERHFRYAGIDSVFRRRQDSYYVFTDDARGQGTEFPIAYTFGVAPLQQYLVAFPGNRLQALSIAWDVGGKRWFHLYPEEKITYRDELHWTGPAQNWNYMCAECHATGYRKAYDAAAGIYRSQAARYDVGCQACHGPAARHVQRWQNRPPDEDTAGKGKQDFAVDLAARDSDRQIDACARCHSHRIALTDDYRAGQALLDTHLPSLLTDPLYFADGQIRGEVYVYGSFVQSKMYAHGVRCSDCHDPHSGRPRAAGNALCTVCHQTGVARDRPAVDLSTLKHQDYDTAAHHFHSPGKPGSFCVDCHAPTRTYMQIDPRRDHSFRIPRPEVASAVGAPDACTGCHRQRSAQWAAQRIAGWYQRKPAAPDHYGLALDAGRRGKAGAVSGLYALVTDTAQPTIVRATALQLLSTYPGRRSAEALVQALADSAAMVRRVAVSGLASMDAGRKTALLPPLLTDPIRAVRMETARLLAPLRQTLPTAAQARLDSAMGEYLASQQQNADRPEALTNLGNFYASRGAGGQAEQYFRRALALDARCVVAYAALADLLRARHEDAAATELLRAGLRQQPHAALLHEMLGFALVRLNRKSEALPEFAASASDAPDSSRAQYVYAVALHDAGRGDDALRLLETAARKQGDRNVLLALTAYHRDRGDVTKANHYLQTLRAINPEDPALSSPGR